MYWLARGEVELPDDDSWLSPAERATLAGYRFTKRRTEYRLRRWAGKHAVAAVTGLEADPSALARIEILNYPGGAPFAQVDGVPAATGISLTDRAGWAVCLAGDALAPADAVPVGTDLELVEPRPDGFVQDFFTPSECAAVRSRPAGQPQHVLVTVLWSAKESALKVLRTGLRADTRSVEVSLGDRSPGDDARTGGWAPFTVDVAGGQAVTGWWRHDGGFVLTVASGVPAPPPDLLSTASSDLAAAVPVHSWREQPVHS